MFAILFAGYCGVDTAQGSCDSRFKKVNSRFLRTHFIENKIDSQAHFTVRHV